jgi:hypothetical protein
MSSSSPLSAVDEIGGFLLTAEPATVQLSTMTGLKKVSFGTSMIQRARRIALDPNLLATLQLQEGDSVTIDLDVESATILIRKDALTDAKRKSGVGKSRA